MARKKHEEHANHERWLVSYADFITLLFAFFTTMYAISYVDKVKLEKLDKSVGNAFGRDRIPPPIAQVSLPSEDDKSGGLRISIFPEDSGMPSFLDDTEDEEFPSTDEEPSDIEQDMGFSPGLDYLYDEINKYLEDSNLKSMIIMSKDKRGIIISLAEAGFFSSGSAQLNPERIPVLDKIAESLAKISPHMRIEGHTDNSSIVETDFSSTWDLSSARAITILEHFIQKHHMNPQKLSVAAYGEYHPIASNETPEGRAMNNRVDIIIMGKYAAESILDQL